jgi:hypothetical protein
MCNTYFDLVYIWMNLNMSRDSFYQSHVLEGVTCHISPTSILHPMPQPEIRERRPSAKQVVLNKAKDKVGKPNTKSHKKRQAKKTADDSPSEESSSNDENQPQKRQKQSQDPEEISEACKSSDDEPEVIAASVFDTSDAEDNYPIDNVETLESIDEDAPVVRPESN